MFRLVIAIMGILLASLIVLTGHAHAAARVVDGNNKKIFFTKDGKKINALEANKLAESNEEVLACQYQDYECNERTGKCSMKNSR